MAFGNNSVQFVDEANDKQHDDTILALVGKPHSKFKCTSSVAQGLP